jgi:SAM-dependent methyltransferase
MLLEPNLASLLDELSAFGAAYDGDAAHRPARMLNITPDTGAFLAVLVKAMGARRILEIGTSNGYSTLWLADAAGSTGRVTTVELAPAKVALARANFARSGLAGRIEQREGDAGDVLASLEDGACDLLFLDSQRNAYLVVAGPQARAAPGRPAGGGQRLLTPAGHGGVYRRRARRQWLHDQPGAGRERRVPGGERLTARCAPGCALMPLSVVAPASRAAKTG